MDQSAKFREWQVRSYHQPLLHVQPCRSAGSVEGYGAQIAPPAQTSPDAPQLLLVHGPVYCAEAARTRERYAKSWVDFILPVNIEGRKPILFAVRRLRDLFRCLN